MVERKLILKQMELVVIMKMKHVSMLLIVGYLLTLSTLLTLILCRLIIRDQIIPHAVSWFTGEAIENRDDLQDDEDQDQYLGFEAEYYDDNEDGDDEYEDLDHGLGSDGYDSDEEYIDNYNRTYNYHQLSNGNLPTFSSTTGASGVASSSASCAAAAAFFAISAAAFFATFAAAAASLASFAFLYVSTVLFASFAFSAASFVSSAASAASFANCAAVTASFAATAAALPALRAVQLQPWEGTHNHSDSIKFFGRRSYTLETVYVREHIDKLRKIQKDLDEIKVKYYDERGKLEVEMAESCEPLYLQRYDIVNGVVKDATNQEDKMKRGVPNFWLIQKGFIFEFHFNTNPFFENPVLAKAYHMNDEDEFFLESSIGTKITWRPGKCLTQKPSTNKSFFGLFSPPEIPMNLKDTKNTVVVTKLKYEMENDCFMGKNMMHSKQSSTRIEHQLKQNIVNRVNLYCFKGFKLDFYFRANPFFENSVLTKTYFMSDEDRSIVKDITGTKIKWYPTRCLTKIPIRKKPETESEYARSIATFEDYDSCFPFFNSLEVDDIDKRIEQMQHDFTIGSIILHQIIPHAVSWFTGEAIVCSDDEDQYLGLEYKFEDIDECQDAYEDLDDGL
ncbi:hypothetical protein ACLB2K_018898 [Fragaria x ananassa]